MCHPPHGTAKCDRSTKLHTANNSSLGSGGSTIETGPSEAATCSSCWTLRRVPLWAPRRSRSRSATSSIVWTASRTAAWCRKCRAGDHPEHMAFASAMVSGHEAGNLTKSTSAALAMTAERSATVQPAGSMVPRARADLATRWSRQAAAILKAGQVATASRKPAMASWPFATAKIAAVLSALCATLGSAPKTPATG